jgi:hypothetical protein
MKKLLIIALSFGLVLGASAQRGGHGGGFGGGYHGGGISYSPAYSRPFYGGYGYGYGGWGLGLGYGFGFGYGLGYGLGAWNPYWGYPNAPYYNDKYMPSRLALQIEDIKNDYKEKIASTKDNKSMTRKERRVTVRQLKHDQTQAIIDAKRNYYYNSRGNNGNSYNGNRNSGNGNNNGNNSGSKSSSDDGSLNEYKQ